MMNEGHRFRNVRYIGTLPSLLRLYVICTSPKILASHTRTDRISRDFTNLCFPTISTTTENELTPTRYVPSLFIPHRIDEFDLVEFSFSLQERRVGGLTVVLLTDGCSQICRRASEEEAVRRDSLPATGSMLGGEAPPISKLVLPQIDLLSVARMKTPLLLRDGIFVRRLHSYASRGGCGTQSKAFLACAVLLYTR